MEGPHADGTCCFAGRDRSADHPRHQSVSAAMCIVGIGVNIQTQHQKLTKCQLLLGTSPNSL